MADNKEQSREAIEDIQGAYEIPKRTITAGGGNAYTTKTTNGGSANQPGKSAGDLSIKLDVDCSEALTGLKAIQREAKKAAQALRELEDAKLQERLLRHHEKESIMRVVTELKQAHGGEGWLIGNIIEKALED